MWPKTRDNFHIPSSPYVLEGEIKAFKLEKRIHLEIHINEANLYTRIEKKFITVIINVIGNIEIPPRGPWFFRNYPTASAARENALISKFYQNPLELGNSPHLHLPVVLFWSGDFERQRFETRAWSQLITLTYTSILGKVRHGPTTNTWLHWDFKLILFYSNITNNQYGNEIYILIK